MTREEVIKSLGICSGGEVGCDNCAYVGRVYCYTQLKKDAAKLLEFDREKEMASTPSKVVEYKILNREDILSEFHELIFSHVNFFMDAKDENSKSDALSMIIGAAILTHNLLNPKIKEEVPNA